MSNLVHNEKVKLTATLCNNIAVASLTAGWLVPLVGLIFRIGSLEVKDVAIFFIVSNTFGAGSFWFFGTLAQKTLNRLIE